MTETGEIRTEFKKKSIRSYVIRGGRMTHGQKKAFEDYWSQYGVSLFDGPLDIPAAFGREAPLVLEIGFGMGGSLLEMATAEPNKDFIGIEVHPPGVGCLINNAGKQGLSNLKVYMADAIDVLEDCVTYGSIDRLQLYFPDPWHKKRHNKRRIVQPAFLDKLLPRLKMGGLIHMATDWEPYAEHMMEVLSADDRIINTAGEGQYSARPAYRPVTKFEQRGERLGHGVWDLIFSKR
jgi:tRNA (guanine-N7-)-methyltransferase